MWTWRITTITYCADEPPTDTSYTSSASSKRCASTSARRAPRSAWGRSHRICSTNEYCCAICTSGSVHGGIPIYHQPSEPSRSLHGQVLRPVRDAPGIIWGRAALSVPGDSPRYGSVAGMEPCSPWRCWTWSRRSCQRKPGNDDSAHFLTPEIIHDPHIGTRTRYFTFTIKSHAPDKLSDQNPIARS